MKNEWLRRQGEGIEDRNKCFKTDVNKISKRLITSLKIKKTFSKRVFACRYYGNSGARIGYQVVQWHWFLVGPGAYIHLGGPL